MEIKNKKAIIRCIEKDSNDVITNVSSAGKASAMTKKKFIEEYRIKEKSGDVNGIETSDGTKVHIVKEACLRTDGDHDKNNDLLDLPICK